MVHISPSSENSLSKESAVDTFQIRSVAKERFIKKMGIVSDFILEDIVDSLAVVLGIGKE